LLWLAGSFVLGVGTSEAVAVRETHGDIVAASEVRKLLAAAVERILEAEEAEAHCVQCTLG
jgi:hypothetical protein